MATVKTAAKEVANGCVQRITVHVVPGAKHTEYVGAHGDALKVRVTAPPVDGKANALLQRFLADTFGLGNSAVELVGGATSRRKIFTLTWSDAAQKALGEQRLTDMMVSKP